MRPRRGEPPVLRPAPRLPALLATVLVLAALSPARAEEVVKEIPWIKDLPEAFAKAKAEDRPLMICINARRVGIGRVEPAAKELRTRTYKDPRVVAFASKQDTDQNLIKLAKRLLSDEALKAGARLGLGTHDIQLIARLNDYVEGARLPKDAYEIQMLYGIRTQDQLRLAAGGFAMRVLVSYGNAWFRWYMRRLAERPANLWFVAKSVVR